MLTAENQRKRKSPITSDVTLCRLFEQLAIEQLLETVFFSLKCITGILAGVNVIVTIDMILLSLSFLFVSVYLLATMFFVKQSLIIIISMES